MMRCLGESWQVIKPVEFVVESMGSDPSLMPCPEPALSVLRVAFDLHLGNNLAILKLRFRVPFSMPRRRRPTPQETAADATPRSWTASGMRGCLKTRKSNWKCCLEGTRLSFGDFRALQQGQVVSFDHGLSQPFARV